MRRASRLRHEANRKDRVDPILYPRIYFKGQFVVDPPTANNNFVDYLIDVDNVKLTNYWESLSDARLVAAMHSLEPRLEIGGGQEQIVPLIPSYWNYYGTNAFSFKDVTVTGADILAQGENQAIADDPVVGTTVQLLGNVAGKGRTPALMTQLDPTDSMSALIYSDLFSMGAEGNHCRGDGPSCAKLRWTYIPRNLNAPDSSASASAIFQIVIPPQQVEIVNRENSQILGALGEAAEHGYGLAVLFCLYFSPPPELDAQQLAERYLQGQKPSNPRQGQLVGTITPWRPGALATMPPGRLLQPSRTFSPARPHLLPLGPALAQIDYEREVVLLNLISTVPETGPSLEKVDLGEITLAVLDAGGRRHTVGTFTYDRYDKAAYEATSGAVELSYAHDAHVAATIEDGLLELSVAGPAEFGPNPVLTEADHVIVSDDRFLWLDFDESRQMQINVFRRGEPAPNVPVRAGQWRSRMLDPGGRSQQPVQPTVGVLPAQGFDGPVLNITPEIGITDENGIATFTVEPAFAGSAIVYFWVDGMQEPPSNPSLLSLLTVFYAGVRVLPDDTHLDSIADPDWETVYRNVLRYYYILYPGMNRFFALNDKEAVKAQASAILARMDQGAIGSTLYMPVSRDMSAGKRRLLRRWLNKFVEPENEGEVRPRPKSRLTDAGILRRPPR